MNDRPTPETDEQINGKPCTRFSIAAGDSLRDALVPSEFARKLERERDEARDDLAEETKFHHRTHSELVQAQCQLQDVIRERDEAMQSAEVFSALAWKLEGERNEARRRLHEVLKILDHYDQSMKNPSKPFVEAFKNWFNWEATK